MRRRFARGIGCGHDVGVDDLSFLVEAAVCANGAHDVSRLSPEAEPVVEPVAGSACRCKEPHIANVDLSVVNPRNDLMRPTRQARALGCLSPRVLG